MTQCGQETRHLSSDSIITWRCDLTQGTCLCRIFLCEEKTQGSHSFYLADLKPEVLNTSKEMGALLKFSESTKCYTMKAILKVEVSQLSPLESGLFSPSGWAIVWVP